MSNDIKVGDLVQVVKPKACCGAVTEANGIVYEVRSISAHSWNCTFCGVYHQTDRADGGDGHSLEVYRLRRIPPLSELEGQRTEEGLREPACN